MFFASIDKIFNKILIFVIFAYIYFRFFVFARLLLLHLLLHIYRICFEIFNIHNDQSIIYVSINESFDNVDR